MKEQQLKEIIAVLNGTDKKRKYYVYRLIDPRTFQTFYVGKGSGDRVFQHVKDVKSLISKNDDAVSLKSQQIAEILACGKQVISIIHRWGLTKNEAFEVEAALIDAYPGLTNIQSGHDAERGAIRRLCAHQNISKCHSGKWKSLRCYSHVVESKSRKSKSI